MMNNMTIIEFFHWYYSTEGNLWKHAADQSAYLASLGVSHVWLPPAFKSAYGTFDPGYAVYDLYDLGEFDQKGTVRTRFGTKDEYLRCIKTLHKHRIQVVADTVLNHRHGADEQEKVPVIQVDAEDRTKTIGERIEMDVWTKFTFPGRNHKYSDYQWDWHGFSGIDGGGEHPHLIYKLLNEYGDEWATLIEDEKGNFDYLSGADVEFRNPTVREELKKWGQWYIETCKIDGLRLDAIKHISPEFFVEWLDHLRNHFQRNFFCVGEYWRKDVHVLMKYIEVTGGRMQLMDVPLHYNFQDASLAGNNYDLRTIFDNTLVQLNPNFSVTFVDNHDTQPLQALESVVEFWFKPLANALILLREQGIPCIFYPSLYGAKYVDKRGDEEVYIELNAVPGLPAMMKARRHLSYGMQRDYFDHSNTIGWTREGIKTKAFSGCAVLMTNGSAGNKSMEVGKRHAGKTFVDISGGRPEKIKIDRNGWGDFLVHDASVSVWIREEAVKFIG
jgi:alpha-amylase